METGNNNDTSYGTSGNDWCGYFVKYVIKNSVGYSQSFTPQSSTYKYETKVDEESKTNALDGYQPYSGDVFYYFTDNNSDGLSDEGTRSHIGLVLGSDENYMYTVEGNVGGMVQFVKREYEGVEDLNFVMNNSGEHMSTNLSALDFVDKTEY